VVGGILKKFAQENEVEQGFLSQKAKFIAKGAIDLCMYMHPRQLSIKRQKKVGIQF
jgi:hypothetical protein